MRAKESIIKEIKNLLSSAQKDVLNEINNQKNFFARLFGASGVEALKSAQSNIAKAVNHLESLGAEDSQTTAKLQANLSEKDSEIKDLNQKLAGANDEISSLKSKITFLENQTHKLEEQASASPQEEEAVVETSKANQEDSSIKDLLSKLEEEKDKLTQERDALNEQCQSSNKELKEVKNITVELNKRLSKLKAEILVS